MLLPRRKGPRLFTVELALVAWVSGSQSCALFVCSRDWLQVLTANGPGARASAALAFMQELLKVRETYGNRDGPGKMKVEENLKYFDDVMKQWTELMAARFDGTKSNAAYMKKAILLFSAKYNGVAWAAWIKGWADFGCKFVNFAARVADPRLAEFLADVDKQ